MTNDAQLAFIASLPVIMTGLGTLIVITLGALTALIVAIRQAKKNAEVAEKKLDEIHQVSNSHLTAVTTKWEDVTNELKESKIEAEKTNTVIAGFQQTIDALVKREDAAAPVRVEAAKKTGEIFTKIEESGGILSNGNLAALIKEISDTNKKVEEMSKTLASLVKRAHKP